MRYRRRPLGDVTAWDVGVDGNGYRIAAWSQQLARDLPRVAEGYSGAGAGRAARFVATSFVARWTELCLGDDQATDRVTDNGRDAPRWFWPVIDVPDSDDPMYPRLVLADGLIGQWLVHELPAEVVIEELHTAVEALLRRRLSAKRGTKWPMLLRTARARGLISSGDVQRLDRFAIAHRNRLKHEARAIPEAESGTVRDLLYDVLTVTEHLLSTSAHAEPGR
jgi:hypothetical protein